MATYKIVAKGTDPLGPGEIAAGSPIDVSEGDVFIIDPSADAEITFEANGGTPASFDIVISDSNANEFALIFLADLTPTVTIADNVDVADISIDAKDTDAINLSTGENVLLGKYEGSVTGVDTVTIGDDFYSAAEWKTAGGDDVVVIGENATFVEKFGTAEGDDTITIGSNFSAPEIDAGAGNDTLNTQSPSQLTKSVETTNTVCYAPGTLIDTPDGPRAVETLCAGDLVLTVDNSPQPIRWVRSSNHALEEARVKEKPVLIQAGALGAGRPARDLIVSPQHRILVGGGGQLTQYFDAQAFAPAKSLTELPGIRHMKGKTNITWVHFACDRHEVVIANGCYSESLLLGSMVLSGLSRSEKQEVFGLFGMASGALNGPAAHSCLNVGEVRRHLAICRKDKERHATDEIRKWDIDLAMESYEAARLGQASSDPNTRDVRLTS